MAKLLTQWPFVNSSLVNELKRLKFFPHTWNPQILTVLFPFWLQVLEKWFLDGMPGFLVTIFTLNLRSHPFKMICSKYIFIMCHVGMRVGSKRKVTIPPALGWVHYSPPSSISLVHVTICEHLLENINCLLFFSHGNRAVGMIQANSWLVYEFELKKVRRTKKASQVSKNPS